MRYDESGNVITHFKGFEMAFGAFGRLVKVALGPGKTIEYLYDHLGRLMARLDRDDVTQFFYAFQDKPYLISHAYKPISGSLTSLLYGPDDRLIYISRDERDYYVVCDRQASPILVLTADEGTVVKEITRTPFGDVTYDSNQNLELPVGFQGGYYDALTKLVHFQVRFVPPNGKSFQTHLHLNVLTQGVL